MSEKAAQPSKSKRMHRIGIIVFCVLWIGFFLLGATWIMSEIADSKPDPLVETAKQLGGATRQEVYAAVGQPDRVIDSAALLELDPPYPLLPGYHPVPLRVFDTLEVYRLAEPGSVTGPASDQTAVVFYYDSAGVVILVALTHPMSEGSDSLHEGVHRSTRRDNHMYY